jgi:undecaprenyl-diphosphatase
MYFTIPPTGGIFGYNQSMTIFQSITLGIVQAITEFLPISSSGHLNLTQHFFNLEPSLSLDIFLNTATLGSVFFFFRKQFKYFFTNLKYVIVGSIPAVLVGFLFKNQIDSLFSTANFLPLFFILSSIFVFSTKFLKSKDSKLDYKKALIIGTFQSIAILPGVSRSGTTIFAALLLGLSTLEAFNFSFCLFIPASIGALVLEAKNLSNLSILNIQYSLTFVIAFIVGILALYILKKVLISHQFWLFGIYAFLLGTSLFFIL